MHTNFIYSCIKNALIYPYNPWFKEFFQINCPNIFFANISFPDKDDLSACLLKEKPKDDPLFQASAHAMLDGLQGWYDAHCQGGCHQVKSQQ